MLLPRHFKLSTFIVHCHWYSYTVHCSREWATQFPSWISSLRFVCLPQDSFDRCEMFVSWRRKRDWTGSVPSLDRWSVVFVATRLSHCVDRRSCIVWQSFDANADIMNARRIPSDVNEWLEGKSIRPKSLLKTELCVDKYFCQSIARNFMQQRSLMCHKS